MSTVSPLRYPGGKAKFYNNIIKIFNDNNIEKPIYCEAFAGGAGLALLLLKNNIVDKLILNDIDKSIYCFWKSILDFNKEFCEMINSVNIDLVEREIQKKIQKDKDILDLTKKSDILKLGFSTFFLNRVNRSGIIRAGVIGGIEQNGNYKMDCRFNKNNLIERIKEINKYKKKIEFYNLDAIDFLKKIENKKKIFIFFDPPYFQKGKDLYTNFYMIEDHINLAKHISNLKQDWITTYDNTEEIKEIYSEFQIKEFDILYSLEKKRKAKEILICKKNLII
ncbi:DNA adenine methylase [Fusobacterium hwasookii]|uniref:site-specific DNA-methyltransferase (adenine-specific) n=1 Tax=Fusobacterium hwasookii ChDC F128 TaxID=1216362 RepID=A0ABN0H1D3_9FUSO|nr:DNA adenine methylase [Fusobacterium hwasookii]EJU08058.1 adenine-specific DNA methyltransferase [Fusobacterium hwasookii ChDC F128]QNE65514.1 DNA adenine methylase [Fusobacterium hwasookii]